MESQNMDRRDSKKSNKGGGSKSQARGNSGNGGGGGGKSPTGGGEKQRSHSQKSGKRYQEIYKPPSLRSSKNRNSNSSSEQQQSSQRGNIQDDGPQQGSNQFTSKKNNSSNNNSTTPISCGKAIGNISPQLNDMTNDPSNNAYSLFGNGSNNPTNNGNSSVPSSPLISNRMQNNFNFGLAKRMFNVNAKEFQFLPIQQQQQQQQQISNFLSQFDPSLFYNNSPILASSGCYPLKQSKSSGNMNLLLQQAQQQQQAQAAAIQQLQIAMGLNASLQSGNFSTGNANGNGSNQFNRLSQSKSSGNVPGNGNRPRVRFDDEEVDFDDVDDDIIAGQLGNYLASLKMNGDLPGVSPASNFPMGFPFQQQQQQQQQKQAKAVPLSPQPVLKSSLQKSRTGFYLNLYGNQQQQQQQQPHQPQLQLGSPTRQAYGFNTSPSMHPGTNYATKLTSSNVSSNNGQHPSFSGSAGLVKRSRSFGPGNHHLPRVSATALLSASSSTHSSTSPGHSFYSDFCITKWPRAVQELVTAAVTGVERIPARNWIEMVNGIFEAMLCDYRPKKKDKNTMGAVGADSKSVGITTIGKASGIAASNGTNNDKLSAELSVAAGSSSLESTTGKNQNADLATENNDHAHNVADNEYDEGDDDDDDTDLTSAAVHIVLYFIQREKDRTVMESLLNTCFASFQRLSSASISSTTNSSSATGKSIRTQKIMDQTGKPSISRQWCNFLRFLSTLYSQVKLIRRQKQSQQQSGHSMDEMSFSLLALLCDSCLATLRSPQSYTAEMMGCLFTVLTSIGRDMEGTFPLKMKQLLAAVRDALLGIGPYHQQQQQQHHHLSNPNSSSPTTSKSSVSSLSPIVQKTLMQLIELHAANWQLPASAVRYYYSSVSNSKSTSSSTNSGSSSYGNNQTQSPKSNNNNHSNNGAVTTTTRNNHISTTSTVRPSSSSSVSSSSNDNDEIKDNNNAAGSSVISAVSSVQSNADGNGTGSMPDVDQKVNSGGTGNSEKNERTKDEAVEAQVTPTPLT